ncbi:MAG: DUF4012 domain-containing protein [Acidimicrobiales bacterium]
MGRRWRWVRRGVVLFLAAWAGVAAILLLSARSASEDAFDQLDRAQRRRTFSALVDRETAQRIGSAQQGFADAAQTLESPWLAPLRVVPVLGRQVRASSRLTRAAADASTIAVDALDDLRLATDGPAPGGQERITLLRDLATTVERSRTRLAAIDGPDGKALITPLLEARTEFLDAQTEAAEGLERAESVLRGMSQLLEGGTYLLLGANNAEMRAGSGMFLSASTITTQGGRLDLGDVRPTNDLVLGAGVPVDGELAENWPWLEPGRDFRNLGLTPRFAISAEIASRMWLQVPGGGPVDGVMAVDVEGLRRLLRVVGPVTVGEIRYTSTTVREQLLHGQYRRFGGDQQARVDELGQVARAVFARLEDGGGKIDSLATEMVAAAGGRHLLLWSSDDAEQAAWRTASVDGRLQEDSLGVSVLSRGANKLDWFLDVTSTVEVERQEAATEVTVEVDLANRTPDGEPRYVTGPNVDGLFPGEYSGIVVVNLPRAARAVRVTGGAYQTLAGADGPTQVRGTYLRLPRGRTDTVKVTFRLPAGPGSLVLEPSGRVRPTTWRSGGETWKEEKRRTVRW